MAKLLSKMKKLILFVVMALFFASCAVQNTQATVGVPTPHVTVTSTPHIEHVTGSWHVRSEPSVSGEHICFIENASVEVLEKKSGWLKISACNGGWINANAIR